VTDLTMVLLVGRCKS